MTPESLPHVDPPVSALKRNNTTTGPPRPRKIAGAPVARSNSTSANSRSPQSQSRFASPFGVKASGWNEIGESSSNSLNEDDEDDAIEGGEWGLHKDMELFEVSAKDDYGQ
jgi:hypothetical protein